MCLAFLSAFALLIALSMLVYPGGTAWDPTTRGHDFWLNYLCDLERATALDGTPNPLGARLAQLAMLMLACGVGPVWWSAPRLFARRASLGLGARWVGSASSAGIAAVALLPNDRFGWLHPALMAVACGGGLVAGACAIVGIAAHDRVATLVGWLAFAVTATDFALYAVAIADGGSGPRAIAVLERVSLLLCLTWVVLVARRVGLRDAEGVELGVERSTADAE